MRGGNLEVSSNSTMESASTSNHKVIYLNGGLGNQLFQFAFGVFLVKIYGFSVVYDRSFLDISLPGTTKRLFAMENIKTEAMFNKRSPIIVYTLFFIALVKKKLKSKFSITSDTFWETTKSVLTKEEISDSKYLIGYWQNYRYLEPIRMELLKTFSVKSEKSPEYLKYKSMIVECQESVSIHVRRGDYISNSKSSKIYKICDLEYYKAAANLVEGQLKNPQFFIFSDDLDWCRENFIFLKDVVYVSVPNQDPFAELYLQSMCHSNIIANSTFSWWSAWLNTYPDKKIIAPKQWFLSQDANHLLPADWIVL